MRLMRIGPAGAERPVLLDGSGQYFDLGGVTSDIDPAFFAGDGIERVRAAHAAGSLPVFDAAGQRIGAPIARPSVVLCIGMNYAAHAVESGAQPPEQPVMFYKAPNTVVGPDDDVLIPRGSKETDWEVELAVVVGRRVRYLSSPDEALSYVAGYVIANDVSEREFQLRQSGGQWSKGKSSETFNPLGPWLVTADEVADPQALRLRSWVNGEPRQDSSTADMVFNVATLIYQLSQVTVLEPGDLINTGTPEGVALSGRFPYLTAGDVVELEIDGLGRQRQLFQQA
ncbi:2-hydroxyhepta-2,4-diene-1,7-dioate isomerase [Asanoa ishikariensis]|uniref:2-keto-4-pentenoate hydratase/2-oxohepta-3-ene-1,7-dioic acid hydratase (Catechol pathway) n=1 Tax=Asanoa ishikariensis TaxID=137265 RepID=A0A1H3MVD1_9ACTN|nr:fumarylacetoacetate hydrolase family protein [Asanoa ishikariensis]GIF66370.1 2-hydroxyhepta-2,4-diene-1,7-dioate isomerase [Asanoa ishikariensis]SDY80682.1 2-keto-4-pentenoate hydratase/2-oxohepta-3-ene-1,7-dioic acid hydratase (catechol pathway) [Asanoa ishikariensis]